MPDYLENEIKKDESLDSLIAGMTKTQESSPYQTERIISQSLDIQPNGDVMIGDYANTYGCLWDASAMTFDIKGTVTAYGGIIGGWTIGATNLSATSGGNTTILSSGATALSAGPTGTPTATITQAGVLTATGASITGDLYIDRLFYRKLTYYSAFDTIDAWTITKIGSGGMSKEIFTAQVYAGASINDYTIVTLSNSEDIVKQNFAKNPVFESSLAFNDVTNIDATFGIGSDGESYPLNEGRVGFRVNDDKIYTITNDGVDETSTLINGVTPITLTPLRYKLIVTSGSNVKFYIDDVLVATHTTNIPTDTHRSFIFYAIKTLQADFANFYLINTFYQQDY